MSDPATPTPPLGADQLALARALATRERAAAPPASDWVDGLAPLSLAQERV